MRNIFYLSETLAQILVFDVIYTSNFDISFMGKWVPRVDTRGAYLIFHIKFDSEEKIYTKLFMLKPLGRAADDGASYARCLSRG